MNLHTKLIAMDMTSYINVKTNQTSKNFKVKLKIYVKYRAHAKKIVIARGSGTGDWAQWELQRRYDILPHVGVNLPD